MVLVFVLLVLKSSNLLSHEISLKAFSNLFLHILLHGKASVVCN